MPVAESIDESDIKQVIVALKSVTLLDSIVIGAIIMFAKAATKRDGKAILCNVSEQLWETLKCVRLDKLMDQCATREEALAALKT